MSADTSSTPGGYREVIRLAWPLVVSMGSFTVMQFIDRMFLAWHSPVSIQAALPAGILAFTFICGFMALTGYANTFVAQYQGSGDAEGCSRSMMQGVWLSFITWPILLVLIPPGCWLITLGGHSPDVMAEEMSYFTLLMAGGIVVTLGSAIGSFFTGRGDTRTNMYATIAGNIVNAVLDYALIFGAWGFPEMGIRGAAIATIIAGLVPPAIMFSLYLGPRLHAVYRTRDNLRFDPALTKRLIRFGLPSGLHLALDIGAFSVFVMFTGRIGPLELAVSNIALSINMVAFLPLIGISIAATTLVGQYQGAGQPDIAARSGWVSTKLGVYYVLAAGLLFILFPRQLYGLFTDRDGGGYTVDELMAAGRWLLVMLAAWGAFDAVNLILSGALKGAGDTRFVMWFHTVAAWGIMVPGVFIIHRIYPDSLLILWAWLIVYIVLLGGGFMWRFAGDRWKSIKVIEPAVVIPSTKVGAEALLVKE